MPGFGGCVSRCTCGQTCGAAGGMNKVEEMHSSGSISQMLARPRLMFTHLVTEWGPVRKTTLLTRRK